MSKLEREVTAVFDEAFKAAQDLVPLMVQWMAEDLEPEEYKKRVEDFMIEKKPKTYAQYTEDLIHVFEANGWKKYEQRHQA